MKKLLLSIVSITLLSISSYAQENEIKDDEYNKWSIEFNVGQSKGIKPYSVGYFASDPNKNWGSIAVNHFSGGVRYMFSPKFGLKLDGAYDNLENFKNSNSLDFEMRHIRFGLQGVVNGPRLFDIQNSLGRFGFLLHGGIQVAFMTPQMGVNEGQTERNGGIMFGITPEFRITKNIAFNADFTFNSNIRQHFNWDGAYSDPNNNLAGSLFTSSVGLSISFGSEKVHGDFAILRDKTRKELEALEERVAKIEIDMTDSDKDGVPDYLDVEQNSIAGIAVDTKGRMIDQNKNGVPDELEKYLERTYATKDSITVTDKEMVTKFINDGYVATYFDFDKRKPTNVSTEGIDFMLTYLRNNPSASIDIIGHADEIGKSPYNDKLAKDRAENVKQTLVKAGINASRLNAISAGEDTSVDVSSVEARRLVRRVTFRVK